VSSDEGGDPSRRIEDWIVGNLGDDGPDPTEDLWNDLIGRISPARKARPGRGRGSRPEAAGDGWDWFRLTRRRGITVVSLTDPILIKEQALRELADDLFALIEAGHHRMILNLAAVERLSSWVVGAMAEACRRCGSAPGGALKVCGLRPSLAAIFSITGLAREIDVYPDETSAVDAVWPDPPTLRPLPIAVLSVLTRASDPTSAGDGAGERARDRSSEATTTGTAEQGGLNAMSGARLVVQVGPLKDRAFAVNAARFVIGRDPSCSLRPNSQSVSRFHAAIEAREGRFFLRDLGSTNGTILNGRTLRGDEAEVAHGDRIQVGPIVLALILDPDREPLAEVEDLVAGWLCDDPTGPQLFSDDAPGTEDLPALGESDGAAPWKVEVVEDVVIVTPLTPDLDGEPLVNRLRTDLLALFEAAVPRRVAVNLMHVGHISGRAIGVLVAHHLRLDRAGGALRLCEAKPRVAALLEQVRLAMLIDYFPTVDDAVLAGWGEPSGEPLVGKVESEG
jgi:anti-anti-sigma factor